MTYQLIQANALHLPIEDESVDLIVTSPPYWGLRTYKDGDSAVEAQIGAEAHPKEFIDALLRATSEMKRVLKPSGSIFVNLGDKYAGSGGHNNASIGGQGRGPSNYPKTGAPAKSLIGIPWRYAIGCVDQLGLLLRAEIIWSKSNGMPDSALDRVRRSHEHWFHLTKNPEYFSSIDYIRESREDAGDGALGKTPGSVWQVNLEPLRVPEELGVDHYAAFPSEWPRQFVLGWSPQGICRTCGEGIRARTAKQSTGDTTSDFGMGKRHQGIGELGPGDRSYKRGQWAPGVFYRITGLSCGCVGGPSAWDRAVVLDPFGGTGTTAAVAHILGRHGVSVDLSLEYQKIARWRCDNEKFRKKVLSKSTFQPCMMSQAENASSLIGITQT